MRVRGCLQILLVVFLAAGAPAAEKGRVPEAAAPEDVRPGEVALLRSARGMRYFLRVPRSYQPKRGARLVVFLHGSNMNGLDYLRSFEARRWGVDDLLLCPNGEKGEEPYGANNFTFESAPYVAEVTADVQAGFRATRTYVGGHSQGGFLTYSVVLRYPDLFQGAFPMAGGCWRQNEPTRWEDQPELLAEQRQLAIAIIHGKKDSVVDFGLAQYAHDVFLATGYAKVRLFAPERLGHQFMLSPVPDALEWLDALVGNDPVLSTKKAVEWAKAAEWSWAVEAARRVIAAKRKPAGASRSCRGILKAAERAAQRQVVAMERARKSQPPSEWIPAWFEFRRVFGATEAAVLLIDAHEKESAAQRSAAVELERVAYRQLREGDDAAARRTLEEIIEKAPATFQAYRAVKRLAE